MTTPGNAVVHKTKNDLNVSCERAGYAHFTQIVPSHFNGATAGNILAGGIIGLGVDAATGANYNYPTSVNFALTPVAVAPAPVAMAKDPES